MVFSIEKVYHPYSSVVYSHYVPHSGVSYCYSTAWDGLQNHWRMSVCLTLCHHCQDRNFYSILVFRDQKTRKEFVNPMTPIHILPLFSPL